MYQENKPPRNSDFAVDGGQLGQTAHHDEVLAPQLAAGSGAPQFAPNTNLDHVWDPWPQNALAATLSGPLGGAALLARQLLSNPRAGLTLGGTCNLTGGQIDKTTGKEKGLWGAGPAGFLEIMPVDPKTGQRRVDATATVGGSGVQPGALFSNAWWTKFGGWGYGKAFSTDPEKDGAPVWGINIMVGPYGIAYNESPVTGPSMRIWEQNRWAVTVGPGDGNSGIIQFDANWSMKDRVKLLQKLPTVLDIKCGGSVLFRHPVIGELVGPHWHHVEPVGRAMRSAVDINAHFERVLEYYHKVREQLQQEQRERANDLYSEAQHLHMSSDGNLQRSLDQTCVLRSQAQSALEGVNRSEFEKALNSGPGHLGEYVSSPDRFAETEKVRKIQKLVNATCDK